MCAQSLNCVWLFGIRQTIATRLLCPWSFPGKNTGEGCHFLFHGIFSAYWWNLGLVHWHVDSLPGKPAFNLVPNNPHEHFCFYFINYLSHAIFYFFKNPVWLCMTLYLFKICTCLLIIGWVLFILFRLSVATDLTWEHSVCIFECCNSLTYAHCIENLAYELRLYAASSYTHFFATLHLWIFFSSYFALIDRTNR